MPRGKNTNVYLKCEESGMLNYTMRLNMKTSKTIRLKKFCPKLNKHTWHTNTKEIKHSS